jgi:two-component system sensor histidine kinase MprB
MTVPIAGVGAVQIARSARETENALDVIRMRTLFAAALVVAAAGIAGWLIGRQVTRRLRRLTQAADDVATTGRLDVEVPVGGTDETGRLGTALNGMLGALARSRDQQQQLVQDAGHELRTPLTSLRTNVAVLRRIDNLPPDSRRQLVDDLESETKELTELVNELVELATDRRDDEPTQDCDLSALAEQPRRVRRRTAADHSRRLLDGVVPSGGDDQAIISLIDNAAVSLRNRPAGPVGSGSRTGLGQRPGPGYPGRLPHLRPLLPLGQSRSLPAPASVWRSCDIVESGGTVFCGRDGGGTTVGHTADGTRRPGHPGRPETLPVHTGPTRTRPRSPPPQLIGSG